MRALPYEASKKIVTFHRILIALLIWGDFRHHTEPRELNPRMALDEQYTFIPIRYISYTSVIRNSPLIPPKIASVSYLPICKLEVGFNTPNLASNSLN